VHHLRTTLDAYNVLPLELHIRMLDMDHLLTALASFCSCELDSTSKHDTDMHRQYGFWIPTGEALLSELYMAADKAQLLGHALQQALFLALLQLCSQPLLDYLNSWLGLSALVTDAYDEFFIDTHNVGNYLEHGDAYWSAGPKVWPLMCMTFH
jgi:hypothetical protein